MTNEYPNFSQSNAQPNTIDPCMAERMIGQMKMKTAH